MNDNIKGILLIVLGMALFSFQDLFIKYLIENISLLQILVFRGIIGSVCLIIFLKYRGKAVSFGTFYPLIALTRAIFFFLGFLFFYLSLSAIKLAEATSLFFMSPLFMTIFSKFILKNEVGVYRILAIMIGFSGSLLIVKPNFQSLQWPMLLPIFCAATYSLSMILAKISSDKDNVFQQSFHIYLSSFVLGLFAAITFAYSDTNFGNQEIFNNLSKPWIFSGASLMGPLLVVSLLGSLGILCLIMAYRIGSPILNSPSGYVLLIFSIASGYFVFSEIPDFMSLIGIGLIAKSGLLILFREQIRRQPLAVNTNFRN